METKLEPVCSTLCPNCGETGGVAGVEVPAPTPKTDVLVGAGGGGGTGEANAGVAKVAQSEKNVAPRIEESSMKTPRNIDRNSPITKSQIHLHKMFATN